MAPVIVIILSPLVLREKLSPIKIISVIVALMGMFFVSGVLKTGLGSLHEMKGVLFGLGAALLYACVILLNKKIKDISPFDKTIYQLGIAGIVLLPYTYLTENFSSINLDNTSLGLLLVVGVVHTGITYYLYFGSLSGLDAQTAALYSYIDPIFAILLSALLLKESMGVFEIAGTVLILGSTILCEIYPTLAKKRK
jgi:drug/metabolite transporter (DMT)-like permease